TARRPARGVAGQNPDQEGERFGDPTKRTAAGRPGYLPDVPGLGGTSPDRPPAIPRDPWQPSGGAQFAQPSNGIRLGQPQPAIPLPPPPNTGQAFMSPANPIGYPR